MSFKNKIFLVVIVALVMVAGTYTAFERLTTSPPPSPDTLIIDGTSGNYGLFIDNLDSGYFSTLDSNVKKIVLAYLLDPDARRDSDKYGSSLVFYYDKDNFITAKLSSPTDRNSITSFMMHDMKTGKPKMDCFIYAQAGLYMDMNLLLSVTFKDNGMSVKYGACFYERGTPNFTFIDMTSSLKPTETLFNDPAGRSLKTSIKNLDTLKKTFIVDVYDKTKKDADSNYAYKRSVEISY